MRIGVIGTGAIGMPMTQQVLSHGFDVRFYARRSEVIEQLQSLGGQYCSRKELGEFCDTILLILNSYAQCLECVQEILSTMLSGQIIVHSTISPYEMETLEQLCNNRGVELVAAPITGGVAGACQGTLTIIAGGKKAVIDMLRPIFSSFGTNIIYTGENVASAAATKLLVQMLVGIHTAATAEVLVLGAKCGLDSELIYQTVCASAGMSKIFQNRAKTMMNRNFATRGTIDILHKDLKYCAQLAEQQNAVLPVVQSCFQMFQIGFRTLPDIKEDFSAIIKLYENWGNTIVNKV